jgi:hypothetical protein
MVPWVSGNPYVIFAVLIPIAFFCLLPLLLAVIGGWIARHFRSARRWSGRVAIQRL